MFTPLSFLTPKLTLQHCTGQKAKVCLPIALAFGTLDSELVFHIILP